MKVPQRADSEVEVETKTILQKLHHYIM